MTAAAKKRTAICLGCGLAFLFVGWAAADAVADARKGGKIELIAPLRIGNRVLQGQVGSSDTAGLFDEPAGNLQQPFLVPPHQAGDLPSFDKWIRVKTCREWARLHTEGAVAIDTVNRAFDSGFLIACGTIFAVENGTAAKVSYLPADGLGDIRLYSPLLLGSVVPEEDERDHALAAGGRSFGDLERDPKNPLIIKNGEFREFDRYFAGRDLASDRELVVIRGPEKGITYFYAGTVQHLGLIARGDFNGDGIEDFLASFSSYGGGSLTTTELLILSRKSTGTAIAPIACILVYRSCQLEP